MQPAVRAALVALAAAPVAAAPPPYFSDVTAAVELAGIPAFRLAVADIDGDGYPDIVRHRRSNWATGDVLDNQSVYRNVAGDDPSDPFSRKFVDFTDASRFRQNRLGTPDGRHSDSAIFADVDNDGDLDAFTVVYIHDNDALAVNTNELLLNDGDGRFRLAPSSPFHLEPIYNTAAAVFLDYQNDGDVDLFIGNWYRGGALSRDQLYRGHGDGTFTNVTSAAGIDSAATSVYGVAAWDWDNDGFTDLFAPSYSHTRAGATSIHWRNGGDGTFSRYEATSGFSDHTGAGSGKSVFGSQPYDFDNDGWVDFLSVLTHGFGDGAGGVHTTAVRNDEGVASWDFYRVADRAVDDPDISHHGDHYATWLDFDNDGLVDFALTESGYSNDRFYVFRQASDHTFNAVTVDSGLSAINDAALPPHNVLALDYDRDGDDDLLVGFANNSTPLMLWRNEVGTDNHWLTVALAGAGGAGRANRAAIGARAAVTAGGVTRTREVHAGAGHHGPQEPLVLGFGLGDATVADLRVTWPNAARDAVDYPGVCVDRYLTVREACVAAADPAPIRLVRAGADVALDWPAPADAVWSFNLYRDPGPDPASWGAPHATCVADAAPLEPGVQHVDPGAVAAASGTLLFYKVTALNDCGETAVR